MPRTFRIAAVAVLSGVIVAACSSEEATPEGGASSGSSSGETQSGSSSGLGGSSGASSSGAGSSSGSSPPAPTHTDGIKNLDETDVDCGGASAPKCADLKGCAAAEDCTSGVCDASAKTCSAPTGTDKVKNGDETDIDCGGTKTGAPKCAFGKTCAVHADCASDGCGYDKKCAEGRSCTQHHGGDTCGTAGAQESCCKSMTAGGTVKIDKYAITAGRFRQFVERTNGDIRGWIQANKPAWWESGWDVMVPTKLDDGTYNFATHDGVVQELGPWLFFAATGGNQGCEVESYGARTYRLTDAINTKIGDGQHYAQDDLDDKAMQCATFFMMSAFCAWDGGRLPSIAELNAAWGGAKYPWGATPDPAGWDDSWNNLAEAQANGTKTPATGDQARASFRYNWWSPTNRACGMRAERMGETCPNNMCPWCDYSVHVAPPGRFPTGNGPFGHADLGGNVFNITNQISGAVGSAPAGRNVAWFRNGSWQGHGIPYYAANSPTPSSFKSESKYWATGARCAR